MHYTARTRNSSQSTSVICRLNFLPEHPFKSDLTCWRTNGKEHGRGPRPRLSVAGADDAADELADQGGAGRNQAGALVAADVMSGPNQASLSRPYDNIGESYIGFWR